MAYQIAFDLYESATQDFLRKVQEAIRGSMPAPPPAPPTTEKAAILATPVQETGERMLSCVDFSFRALFRLLRMQLCGFIQGSK